MTTKRKWLLVPATVLLTGGISLAQFGGVFTDPVQSAHAVQQITAAMRREQALLSQVRLTLMTYQMAYANIRAFGSKTAWKGYAMSVYRPMAPNFYGETAGWNNAINYGFDPLATWQRATVAVYPRQGSSPAAGLATVDIVDGTSVAAMQTVADARKTQAANAAVINRYEATVLDGTESAIAESERAPNHHHGTADAREQGPARPDRGGD
jgi:hypothetical protein